MLRGVRGATTVLQNDSSAIQTAVDELIRQLLAQNAIEPSRIVSLFFTLTPDLTALNPAKALRAVDPAFNGVPLLCALEPTIDGDMMPRCIRVLIQWDAADSSRPVAPVYLGEASQLRPDL
jgi:chorismate mutase